MGDSMILNEEFNKIIWQTKYWSRDEQYFSPMNFNRSNSPLSHSDKARINISIQSYICEAFPQFNHTTNVQEVGKLREIQWIPSMSMDIKDLIDGEWVNGNGIKRRLWRTVGELFDKREWIQNGKVKVWVFPALKPIRYPMKAFGHKTGLEQMFHARFAYQPFDDILYIGEV